MKFQQVRNRPIKSWEHFCKIVEKLERVYPEKFTCKMFCVDTVDVLYRHLVAFICRKLDINHPSELPFSKGYDAIKTEWSVWINRLAAIGPGVIFIAHAKERPNLKDDDLRKGETLLSPNIPGTGFEVLNSLCDLILCVECSSRLVNQTIKGKKSVVRKYKRELITKPGGNMELGGDRSGRLPEKLAFDYAVFKDAFAQLNE